MYSISCQNGKTSGRFVEFLCHRLIINTVTSYGKKLAGENWEGGEDEGGGAHSLHCALVVDGQRRDSGLRAYINSSTARIL